MPTARLIIQQPGQRARVAEFAGTVVSVGRRADNTVCLEDSGVSKYHAVIERRGEHYFVTDLGSSNGTTVNDEPLTAQRPLRDGDRICLGGNSTLEFHLAAKPGDAPAPGGAGLPSAPGLTAGLTPPSVPNVNMPHVPGVNMPHAPNVRLPSAPHMPSVQTPHVPTVQAPHVPSIQAPHVPSVQTPSIVHRVLNMPRALLAAVSATLLGGVILAALWGAGVGGGSSSKPAHAADDLTADPLEQLDAAAEPTKDEGSTAAPAASQEQPTAPTTTADAPPPPPPVSAAAANADATAALARALAGQISQKSGYTFDPRFVEQIKTYTNDYRATANYYERAGKYRDAIEREFSNTQGIQPLVPYLLAMSQTKFVERGGGGVWNLSPTLLAQYAGSADTSDPTASTRAAAAYTRALFDTFEQEDFMYAVACYGMSVDDAGELSKALAEKDPGRRLRGDFWKMKSMGVVQGAQVERVARFFAAGIVFENPGQFGLKGQPLSTLY
ncbi:MAG TPA: FHA domain-containing protein [Pyrinomonadaceae bacterium]